MKAKHVAWYALALSVAGFNAPAAHAGVTFLSQSRTLWTWTQAGTAEDQAPNFSAWSSNIGVPPATARMTSDPINVILHAEQAHSSGGHIQIGDARSRFQVQFAVDEPTPFDLTALILGMQLGRSELSLTGPSGSVFSFVYGNQPFEYPQASGMLSPGTYTFVSEIRHDGPANLSQGGTQVFTFMIPTPGAWSLGLAASGVLAFARRREGRAARQV